MAQQAADLGGWAEQGHRRRAGSAPSAERIGPMPTKHLRGLALASAIERGGQTARRQGRD